MGGVREAGKRGQKAGFPRWQEAGEKGEIMQHCAIFGNRKNAKRREPTNTGQGTESGKFNPPPYFPLSLKNLPSFFLIIFPPLLFFTVCYIDLPSS